MRFPLLILLITLAGWNPAFGDDTDQEEASAATGDVATTETDRPKDDPSDLQRYAAKISPHEPMYFSVGWNEGNNAKFQFSFKYRFVNPEGVLADRSTLFNHLYFAYTQTSIWDLESDSAPFFDTSYRPGLFIYRPVVHTASNGRWRMGLESGIEHESNGQGGDDSRSLNIVYAKPIFHLGEVLGARVTVAPKIYAYISGLTDNPDLPEYRGYCDLEIAFTDDDGWKISTMWRKGTKDHYGSVQADFSFPLDKLWKSAFDAFVHIQYFNGWGESLRTYDQKLPHQFRIGLMIVR